MTFGTEWRYRFGDYDHRCLPPDARPQRMLAGAALAGVVLACAWTLCASLAGSGAVQADLPSTRGDKLAVVKPSEPRPSNTFASLFDPHASVFPPATFVMSAAVPSHDQSAAATPSPPEIEATGAIPPAARDDRLVPSLASAAAPPRVQRTRLATVRDGAHEHENDAAAKAPDHKPSIFEKLFGRPATVTLAYAAPDDGGLGGGQGITPGRYDRATAVYDITAHAVYLPDGTKLEAHSGLGSRLDDPRYAGERNRGVTPPAVYDLEPDRKSVV
jgi:hypothetical protein